MRHALANLRGVLGKEQNETLFLLVEREMLQLNPQSDWRVDVAELERLAGEDELEGARKV